MVLSFLFPGTGEIYLGKIKRGILVFLAAVGIFITARLLLPYYLAIIPILFFYVWQLFDTEKVYKKMYPPSESNKRDDSQGVSKV